VGGKAVKIYRMKQGSQEWQMARCGIPTGSNFEKILTPTGKRSKQAEGYLRHLIAEMVMGLPLDSPKTSWMERGIEMEGEAVCYYEMMRDCAVDEIGFITNDAGTYGASPDRLIGDDGLLEIKCPSPQVHVGYMLYSDVDADYRVQLMGQMLVAERDWTDICSYHPALPPVIVRVERDEPYIALLRESVEEFCDRLATERARLIEMGYKLKTSQPGAHSAT
jgi:hypothetical protein